MSHSVVLVRYADDMVLLARTESEAKQAWERLQSQFAALRLVVNQEKSRLTTVEEGFAFLGFEFRKPPRRMLYMWPRKKACQHIRDRVREVVRSIPSSATIGEVIRKHPILNGWCTYFRVGNSNRIFHQIDWAVQSELQLWLRRKHQCSWRPARKHWNYQFLYKRCRLYQMVGRVSHLPACGARRRKKVVGELDAGNPHVQFDEGAQETCDSATRLCPTLPQPLGRRPLPGPQ